MQSLPVPPPPIAPPTEPLRPSGWWYAVAGGIAVVGLAIAGFLVGRTVGGLIDRVDDFERGIPVPGSGNVTIDEPGGYTVYHEYPGADNVDDEQDIFDVSFDATLTAPDGSEVDLDLYDSSVTYDFGGHEGVAIYSFEAEEAGNYELTTTGGPGEAAVGPGIGRGLAAGIVSAVVVGLVSIAAAIVVTVIVAIRRGQDRRRRQVLGPRGPWNAPPGAGWQQPMPPSPAPAPPMPPPTG